MLSSNGLERMPFAAVMVPTTELVSETNGMVMIPPLNANPEQPAVRLDRENLRRSPTAVVPSNPVAPMIFDWSNKEETVKLAQLIRNRMQFVVRENDTLNAWKSAAVSDEVGLEKVDLVRQFSLTV